MSRFSSYEWYEWAGLSMVLVFCLACLLGIGKAVFGPHYPPPPFNAKKEFVESCQYQKGVPDVHTNNWTCEKLK